LQGTILGDADRISLQIGDERAVGRNEAHEDLLLLLRNGVDLEYA
jgi:hypothetical protein